MKRKLGDDEYFMSLAEVAAELGLTRQYVWEVERSALKKVKRRLMEWEDYERNDRGAGPVLPDGYSQRDRL